MLLEAKDIRVSFRKENQTRLFGRERQEVLHGLSIDLEEGECLGIIGESGSGKSTFGRVLCGLLAPDSGTVRLDGLDLYGRLPRADRARIQSSISIVFQDYTTSANPRFRVQGIIGESFRALRLKGAVISREAQRKETIELLERVGLDESFLTRYPHELSFRAASSSARPSPAPWRSNPRFSSATNPSPRSTSRFRRRCSNSSCSFATA